MFSLRQFSSSAAIGNAAAPFSGSVEAAAALPDGSSADSVTRQVSLPKAQTDYTYDLDGNLTSDGAWQYAYDAENRLSSASSLSSPSSPPVKVEFTYDHQGRRSAKHAYTDSGAGWELDSAEHYAWDHYNLIAAFDGDTGNLLKSWTWGESGLISETDHAEGKTYLATADGNRNITAYIDSSDGSIAAEYEYDPGGREIVRSGPKADDFTFRFASYQYDTETGLVYMVHRYYDPDTGRFPSRDPIGIAGGNNPYRITSNDLINKYDVLGLAEGEVLWIIQNDARRYRSEVEKAVKTIAALDTDGKNGGSRIVPLILQQGKQLRPPKYGQLSGNPVPYVIHLKFNNVIDDICWDRVYAMHFDEGTKGMPDHDTNTFTLGGLNPLGYGLNWKVTVWPKRIDEEVKWLKDKNEFPAGANINQWVFVAIMHESAHAVGVSHLFESTAWTRFTGAFKENLKSHPNSLMRPIGSYDWFFGKYKIEDSTKEAILEGFGF